MTISKTELKKYLNEVEKLFLKLGKPFSKADEARNNEASFKGTKYRIYNISNPQYQKILKMPLSFKDFSDSDRAQIWSYIFKNTKWMGVGSLAIDYFKQFQNKKSYDLSKDWKHLKSWAPLIENWVHGDMLCGLYCHILDKKPETVYPELLKWSKAKNPWKNRLAMLSLLYYYNPKRQLLSYNKYISIIKPHILTDHYYLQKAVGWTLRELQKPYGKQTGQFINKNITQFSAISFTTLAENMPKPRKERLKNLRKKHRNQKAK